MCRVFGIKKIGRWRRKRFVFSVIDSTVVHDRVLSLKSYLEDIVEFIRLPGGRDRSRKQCL